MRNRLLYTLMEEFLQDPRTERMLTSDPIRYSLHVAVLVKRGQVLAIATNRNGSRSSGSGYSDRSIHAERNCIKELGDISKLRGADMLVMRVSRPNQIGDRHFLGSEPCTECQLFLNKCIREYGLRHVYYTATDP